MLFTEPTFLFLFLPALTLLHFAVPSRWPAARNALLLAAGVLFYAWGAGPFVLVILALTVLNSGAARVIERLRGEPAGRRLLGAAVAANLAVLAWFKYARFAVENLNPVLGSLGLSSLPEPAAFGVPLGLSFFEFVAIAYLVDVYRGAPTERGLLQIGQYFLFFSRQVAGPIVRRGDLAGQLARRQITRSHFAGGVRRFVAGMGKKLLIANTMAVVANRAFAVPVGDLSPSVAWFGIVCYAMQIYFDFSGYTDMAIGLGAMFGFRFPENFDYPYAATSLRDFWRRWHMTLSGWLRDYLYIPMGGSRCSPARVYLNLVTVFLLCGLWHGANWTFLVWGLVHGLFLVIERAGWERVLNRLWPPLRHAYLLLVLLVTWVLFRAESLPQAVDYLAALCGAGGNAAAQDSVAMYVNAQGVLTLAAAIVAAMPCVPWLRRRWAQGLARARTPGRWAAVGEAVVAAGVLLTFAASILMVAARTYSPFIYARF